jgi:hypothetical protein
MERHLHAYRDELETHPGPEELPLVKEQRKR